MDRVHDDIPDTIENEGQICQVRDGTTHHQCGVEWFSSDEIQELLDGKSIVKQVRGGEASFWQKEVSETTTWKLLKLVVSIIANGQVRMEIVPRIFTNRPALYYDDDDDDDDLDLWVPGPLLQGIIHDLRKADKGKPYKELLREAQVLFKDVDE